MAKNGSRYVLSAGDRSGELFTWQLQAKLKELFPAVGEVGGEEMEDGAPAQHTYDSPRSYCLLAKQELGLAHLLHRRNAESHGRFVFRAGDIAGVVPGRMQAAFSQ